MCWKCDAIAPVCAPWAVTDWEWGRPSHVFVADSEYNAICQERGVLPQECAPCRAPQAAPEAAPPPPPIRLVIVKPGAA